jgi:dephospho-CoA kinase
MARNSLTEEQALDRIRSQLDRNLRIQKADINVSNEGSIEDLYLGVTRQLTQKANLLPR